MDEYYQSQQTPWSDSPNAPQISYSLYHEEKFGFAGSIIGTIFYGIVIALFFQCMAPLFNRTNRSTKWALVAHTTVMFSLATVFIAVELNILSISYIDNREFPGVDRVFPPGPLGYRSLIYSEPINLVPGIMFLLNSWLADGLLLYRCYIIYSMNRWAVSLPCLLYLASLAIGIAYIYQVTRPADLTRLDVAALNFGLPYYSISFALNALLTLMIVVRLVMFNRRIRNAMNAPVRVGGLYKAIVTSLVESCALYSVTSLLFIGFWTAGNPVAALFFPILFEFQTIAPFLITLRVANQNASTNVSIISGDAGSIHFRSQGKSTGGNGALSIGRHPIMSSMATDEETRVKPPGGGITTIDLRCDD